MGLVDLLKKLGCGEKKCEVCGSKKGVRPVACSSYSGRTVIKNLCPMCAMAEKIIRY